MCDTFVTQVPRLAVIGTRSARHITLVILETISTRIAASNPIISHVAICQTFQSASHFSSKKLFNNGPISYIQVRLCLNKKYAKLNNQY